MWRKVKSWADWQLAFAITTALRVFYSGVAAAAAAFFHPDPILIHKNALTENLPSPHGLHYALLGIWERFDTLWYLRISERGYDLQPAVVFYPLYPWLIRVLSHVVEPTLAALLISTTAAFFYFWGLLRLFRSEFPDVQPLRTVALAAVWPASFFFFTGYTEALAIALIVWCVVWARDERWMLAVGCAFAAGLTRSAGTLLVVPLAVMAWRAKRRTRGLVVLAPLGTVGYWFWLHQTGRPSIAAAYRTYWHTQVAPPWTTLWVAIHSLAVHYDSLVMISLFAIVFFFIAGVAARRIEDKCFTAAVIVHLLLRFVSPPLMGAPRYMLPVYPAYLTMGKWLERMEGRRFVILCAALFAFNLAWMRAFLAWSLVL